MLDICLTALILIVTYIIFKVVPQNVYSIEKEKKGKKVSEKNFKVKKTEIQPGMLLFEPDHKAGVVKALTGYFRDTNRKRGYHRAIVPTFTAKSSLGRYRAS